MIKNLLTIAKGVSLIFSILVSLYLFHKKIIIADLDQRFLSRAEATEMAYPKVEGKVLEARVVEIQSNLRDNRDDMKEVKSDIKKILLRMK